MDNERRGEKEREGRGGREGEVRGEAGEKEKGKGLCLFTLVRPRCVNKRTDHRLRQRGSEANISGPTTKALEVDHRRL